MYCPACGTYVENGSKFCRECGNPLTQNVNQTTPYQTTSYQPNYQSAPYQPNDYQSTPYQPAPQQPAPQQPVPASNGVTIKAGANVVYPDGHNEIGDLYISAAEIVFMRKSKAVRLALGFVGSALESGEEALRIRVSDIASGNRTRLGLNPNVYQIVLRNGAVYRFCMNQPKNITYLEQIIGSR